MKLNPVLILIVAWLFAASASAQQDPAATDQEDKKRLDVRTEQNQASLINLDGVVTKRNKYSIEVDTGRSTYSVKLSNDSAIKLRVISPRIDFEKKQLIIDVEGAEKRYRGYPIPVPLFVRINFVHQKQLNRALGQPVKRLSDFELFAKRPRVAVNEKLKWVGELSPGESNRQLKFATTENVYDVLLAKRGSMGGFKISDLKAGITGVRISGKLNDNGEVVAKEILFWPAAGHKKTAQSE